ncbi:hypothetical protein [Nocardioides marmotae]|uniref:hypothetical protein n=1 Tax=Nocardioides marmotae TaxID=2663857 RepID=UPI0012B61D8D|nr:hypothetical protein [Nocardioides marmotae]MBC9732463.1 hypothetical protein [Nocardioides marmotae]MTB83582.1 hypothetical protein [Nocardioides marmotae]
MAEPQVSPTPRTHPVQRWVPVVDGRGRIRMEARWVSAAEATAPALVAPAA